VRFYAQTYAPNRQTAAALASSQLLKAFCF